MLFSFMQISNQDKLIPGILLPSLNRKHSSIVFDFSLPFLCSGKHLLTCFLLSMHL